MRIHEFVSRCVCSITCQGSTREPGTYSVKRKLWVLVDRGCYGDVIVLTDNCQLVDDSQ